MRAEVRVLVGVADDGAELRERGGDGAGVEVEASLKIAAAGQSRILLPIEVHHRALPVASGLPVVAVTAARPVYHFAPNRDYLFSFDWDLTMVNRGRVNNAGFVNDQGYRRDDTTPLLAVIGDSMIETSMIPYPRTVHGRLAGALADRLRVYSFAASGAPMSQYLIWAREAAREYRASALVFTIVGNDFDESHSAYRRTPGFWHYSRTSAAGCSSGCSSTSRGSRAGSPPQSALVRYLRLNLRLGPRWRRVRSSLSAGPSAATRFAGNTAAEASDARVRDWLAVLDAFFRDLPIYSGLPPERITFVLDGFRYPAAAAELRDSYVGRMRAALGDRARARGYEVIDLDPWFFAQHARRSERFEFPRDGHWTAAGHAVAYAALLTSDVLAAALRPSP